VVEEVVVDLQVFQLELVVEVEQVVLEILKVFQFVEILL
tara:strand:- start:520 stop:636 length:117 start_codon:yes stop_codon:yes gene_type:complete